MPRTLLPPRLRLRRLLRVPPPLRTRAVAAALAASTAVALALLAGCGSSADTANALTVGGSGATGGRLSLVAYSTPKDAYAELIPAFQQTAPGRGVTFAQSYGASGAQSRAILAGLPTDVAALSLAPDVTKLVSAGLVAQDWNAGAYHGMVTRSVVVLVVRKGNPKHITGWDDLVRPDVKILTPNPLSSGGARWNVMAAYGAQIKAGRTQAEALDYLKQLFAHVAVQDPSAAASLQTFSRGVGDVLISYENEAIAARDHGQEVDWVVPDATILIENPVAVVNSGRHEQVAKAFVDFLLTKPAQQIFADHGYRPVVEGVSGPHAFPTPAKLFTIGDLGGWSAVTKQFFDPKTGLIVPIEKAVGVSGG
ncbi:MAG TPA: sulfate ABC transporter substrate-binding protein [Kineosporiaceae bacterium]|nr:sulfate ABC transporter substrate-binding protein [Kineosporiaceae bacterium]